MRKMALLLSDKPTPTSVTVKLPQTELMEEEVVPVSKHGKISMYDHLIYHFWISRLEVAEGRGRKRYI